MRYAALFLTLFLLLTIQGGLISHLGFGAAGNIILLFLTVSVILSDFEEILFVCLVGGLMMDLVSASRAGIIVVCFLAVFGSIYLFIKKIVPRDPNRYILYICVIISTVVFTLVFVLCNISLSFLHLESALDWKFMLGKKLILDLIVNIILVYPIFLMYEFIRKKLPQ
jgi:hypothetical protein